ncbi:5'-nucleotidase [Gymnodinialimonas sp. 2307UL20-7]
MDIKQQLEKEPLRIGVSTRALFDLEEEHSVFVEQGVEAYCKLQRELEKQPLRKGSGYEVVERLLDLNEIGKKPQVEVIVLSRNSPDLSLRAFHSIKELGLNVRLGSFTSGRSLGPFVPAWGIDLFLSNEAADVQAAAAAGTAAAKLLTSPQIRTGQDNDREVRFAFDGDAVVFSAESDMIYKDKGLDAFLEHETENASEPMSQGPFGKFLKKLSLLREIHLVKPGVSKVRIGIVTARNAPAHERVIQTLRVWGTPVDEVHFVGPNEKSPILDAMQAHIFFDDQEKHVLGASSVVSAGHVPGPHSSDQPIIPATS